MVFVDEIGGAYPHLNHSPWDNVTLADFVMPWFLFMVGTSLSISLRKYRAARDVGTKTVVVRGLKLFFLGVLLQGGGFPDQYTYGYNLSTMRFCGILNRIGYAYLVAALIELWIPERLPAGARRAPSAPMFPYDGSGGGTSGGGGSGGLFGGGGGGRAPDWPHLGVFTSQIWRWLVATSFVLLHLLLTFFTPVPSWTSSYGFDRQLGSPAMLPLKDNFTIHCNGVRGFIHSPQCSAASYYDRLLFGQDHLGVWMSARLPECTECAPGAPSSFYRPHCHWQPNATDSARGEYNWCFAHMYDPEGALATVPTVGSVWLGVHFGRVLRADGIAGKHAEILLHWGLAALMLLSGGFALHFNGLPMNKQLWSTSYLLFMAGACGAALALTYAAVDARAEDGDVDTDTVHRMIEHDEDGVAALRAAEARRLRSAARNARLRWLTRLQSLLRTLLYPLKAMGMNAILFFFWHGPAEALINAVYLDPPRPGDVLARPKEQSALLGQRGWVHEKALHLLFPHSAQQRQAAFVALKLAVYLAVAVICDRRKYYWKI